MQNPISLSILQDTVMHRDMAARPTALEATPAFIRRAMVHLLSTVSIWDERASQRRALRELTDRQLADIGIDRRLAFEEASKPFWRG